MSDLLITAAVDLEGGDRFVGAGERIAAAHLLGKAGEVRWQRLADGALFARAGAPGPGRRRASALPNAAFATGDDGSFTLIAGRVFEENAEGLRPVRDPAAHYAQAYRRLGEACDKAIVGDYAAIQWFPQQRRLRAARSPMSRQPLHVWRQDGGIVVSSLPRIIFAAGAPTEIDDRKLADTLLLNLVDGSDSWYRGFGRIEQGTAVCFTRGSERRRRFWSIGEIPEVRFRSDDDYVAAVDEQFARALRTELADVQRPGAQLSGGLDSQAVVSYALDAIGPDRRLPTWTAVPMEGWTPDFAERRFASERPYAEAFAAMHPQVEPHFLDAAAARFVEQQDAMMLLSSWPTHNEMIMHSSHSMFAAAADARCDVLLGGDFGNIGFSYDGRTGYPTFLRQGRLRRLVREARLSGDPRPMWRRLFALAVWPHAPLAWRIARDRGNPWTPSPFGTWSPLRPDFARATGAVERATRHGSHPNYYPPASSRRWRAFVLAQSMANAPEIYLGLRLLHGIEYRDPTAFRPLMELCAGMSDDQYLRDGEDRWLARRLLKGRVPEPVRTNRRRGIAGADWAVRFERDRPAMLAEMDALAGDPRIAGIIDIARMRADLAACPGLAEANDQWRSRIYDCLGRGVSYARFVRYSEGRNAG